MYTNSKKRFMKNISLDSLELAQKRRGTEREREREGERERQRDREEGRKGGREEGRKRTT